MATYTRRMRNNNLEIRIADSSCRPQLKDNIIAHENILEMQRISQRHSLTLEN